MDPSCFICLILLKYREQVNENISADTEKHEKQRGGCHRSFPQVVYKSVEKYNM